MYSVHVHVCIHIPPYTDLLQVGEEGEQHPRQVPLSGRLLHHLLAAVRNTTLMTFQATHTHMHSS